MEKLLVILSNAWKYLTAVIGFAGIVYGGFKIYDTIITTQEMVVDVWDQQVIFEGVVTHKLDDLSDSLGRIESKVDDNSRAVYTLDKMMKYERTHRDEYSRAQMEAQLELFEDIIKKKTDRQCT